MFAGLRNQRYIRIMVVNDSTARLKQLDQLETRTFTYVIDIFLICKADKQNLRTFYGFSLIVKRRVNTMDYIPRHARINFTGKFDLITSNAAFQWFNDLDASLTEYKNALSEEGSILFSIFGPLTFRELSLSVKNALGEDARISSDGFLGREELAGMMKARFRESSVKETVVKKKYGSLEELLRHIKYTGARGKRMDSIPLWTRTMLDRIEEAYRSDFGCIEASYHIFYCEALR